MSRPQSSTGESGAELRSQRLLLRRWRDSDRQPFAALNADPEVMEFFAVRLSRQESDALVGRIEADFEQRGYGLWALEVSASGQFIGFTGLSVPDFEAHFTPAVEIGWRLRRSAWGQGFATEAARQAMAFAFDVVQLEEIVSFTTSANERSQVVMRRLGMTRNPTDDFDNPRIPEGSPLRRHVLYRMSAERWRELDTPSPLRKPPCGEGREGSSSSRANQLPATEPSATPGPSSPALD